MLSLWEALKASKGLPASDGFTALFAKSLTGIVSEISGIPPLNLGKIKDVVDYTLHGNTIQNGSPTPDNPVEVHAVGDRTGNLFDKDNITSKNLYIDSHSGTFKKSTATISIFIPCKPNTTYIVSKVLSARFSVAYAPQMPASGDMAYGAIDRNTGTSITITTDSSATYLVMYIYHNVYDTTITLDEIINSLMLIEGSTPLPYEPYGYKIPVETKGKNLLEITDDNSIYYGTLNGYTINDNKVHVTGQTLLGFKVEVRPNTTYTIQRKRTPNVTSDFRIREYSAELTDWMSNHVIQSVNTTSDTATFTTSAETKWVLVTVYVTANQEAFTIYDLQLELGATATEYEPYHEPITTPIYLDNPLYKIGDYADSVSYAEQKAERVVKELVLTGKEKWVIRPAWKGNSTSVFYVGSSDIIAGSTSNNLSFIMSDRFVSCSRNELYNNDVNSVALTGSNSITIRISDSIATTIDDFRSYLAAQYANGTPVKVYYVLAEPETESVTLPKIPTLDGTTVIDVETEIEPSNMYIKYKSRR